MKRTDRKVSEATRKKIAEALRGKPKTIEHKQALSKSLKAYWTTIPIEPMNTKNGQAKPYPLK